MSQPGVGGRDQSLDEVLAAYLKAADDGRAPDRQDLLARYPELAGDLAAFFADHDDLRRQLGAADASPVRQERLPDPFPGEFCVLCFLGRGGFGTVWLAEDSNLGRSVALKTLRCPSPGPAAEKALAALRHEAQLLARLSHPNIVQVHGWRTAGDAHYLVLEYVAGGFLADCLRQRLRAGQGPFNWDVAARYIADVAEGLARAHENCVVHRDIKPANLLWDPDRDEAKLTDFGVAGRLGAATTVAGTPAYMAPEAFAGRVSERSDVYSLAASLFHLVTGEVPAVAGELPEADPRCATMPVALEQLLRVGLAQEVAGRPDVPSFLERLRGLLNQHLTDLLPRPLALPPTASLAGPNGAAVRLSVLRATPAGGFVCLAASQTATASDGYAVRDIKRVAPLAPRVRLCSGDLIRLTVEADRDGHLVVFNVGPTGNLNVLHPEDPTQASGWPTVRARQPVHVLDLTLEPPAGKERLVAVWSRLPRPFRFDELGSLAAGPAGVSVPYRASRDITRMRKELGQLPAEDWSVAVLEVDHD